VFISVSDGQHQPGYPHVSLIVIHRFSPLLEQAVAGTAAAIWHHQAEHYFRHFARGTIGVSNRNGTANHFFLGMLN
jgi:hypothetical protein